MTSNTRLIFDPHGAKCHKLLTFYRLCGHVETSYLHTSMCALAIRSGLQPGLAGLTFCWCPFPLSTHLTYCVGKCNVCQETEEPGVNRANEPHRNVLRGSQASVSWTRRSYTAEKIRMLAKKWRGLVKEQERMVDTRTERLKGVKEVERTRRERELQWERAWEQHKRETDPDHQAPIIHGDALFENGTAVIRTFEQRRRVKILDLTDDFSRPRTEDDLLEIAPKVTPKDGDCSICMNKLFEPSLFSVDNAEDAVVRFQGGCRHAFHRQCIITLLITDKAQCPTCRALHKFVLKNGFDDPKFRWILENPRDTLPGQVAEHRLWQVSGYLPFAQELDGKDFKPFDVEDRWGDLEAR
ncbi:uncharacterized protein K444DRAFT_712090 [Hyaloscypha bicolor E]|uniref:RING-type domain-containing protein n=1 Tax=Hyaloscypha bicolor E TaxID=1095630 RepID=A0A2J6SGR2_9HELO|nr:uncharacterized protein K444DRAFT_712090 [Hyaloscypha bicolor E]PMD49961.1 hypothetical protein K444DRAFT_712090 [Hyaloscypha bicolor E]